MADHLERTRWVVRQVARRYHAIDRDPKLRCLPRSLQTPEGVSAPRCLGARSRRRGNPVQPRSAWSSQGFHPRDTQEKEQRYLRLRRIRMRTRSCLRPAGVLLPLHRDRPPLNRALRRLQLCPWVGRSRPRSLPRRGASSELRAVHRRWDRRYGPSPSDPPSGLIARSARDETEHRSSGNPCASAQDRGRSRCIEFFPCAEGVLPCFRHLSL
ncbi:hypothetical protein MetexDRAFT_3781 [Methylorubrum extorquens DSM 13060]|uniref:Uncharacterized protein n=1 Tax=Methylorubrum extorquens DSM 13060 TaxID=882800 RepID=H1KMB8_METEX|nr:hypothetical protein MetexDRAFT_3781 [Methylorubrum extorquens DSM 13060]